jgi:hypothetical protein
MGKMVDLKRDAEDTESGEDAMPMEKGSYPYGCCISLDKDELDKLGIKVLPTVGREVHIVAVGKVTRVSQSASEVPGGIDEQTGISIQIMMMSADVEEPHPGEENETVADEMKETKTLLQSY